MVGGAWAFGGGALSWRCGREHLVWANSDWTGKGACWRRVLSFSCVSLMVMLTACDEPCEHLFWFQHNPVLYLRLTMLIVPFMMVWFPPASKWSYYGAPKGTWWWWKMFGSPVKALRSLKKHVLYVNGCAFSQNSFVSLNFAFPRKNLLYVARFLHSPKKHCIMLFIFLFSPKTLRYISKLYFLAKPLHSQSSSPRNFAFSVK